MHFVIFQCKNFWQKLVRIQNNNSWYICVLPCTKCFAFIILSLSPNRVMYIMQILSCPFCRWVNWRSSQWSSFSQGHMCKIDRKADLKEGLRQHDVEKDVGFSITTVSEIQVQLLLVTFWSASLWPWGSPFPSFCLSLQNEGVVLDGLQGFLQFKCCNPPYTY